MVVELCLPRICDTNPDAGKIENRETHGSKDETSDSSGSSSSLDGTTCCHIQGQLASSLPSIAMIEMVKYQHVMTGYVPQKLGLPMSVVSELGCAWYDMYLGS